MNFVQSFKMAFKSLSVNKVRTFLTILGVVIGVFAVALLTTVTDRATGEVIGQLKKESQTVVLSLSDNAGMTETEFKNRIINNLNEDIGEFSYATIISGTKNIAYKNSDGNFVQKMVEPLELTDELKEQEYQRIYNNPVDIETSYSQVFPNFFEVRNMSIVGEALTEKDTDKVVVTRAFIDAFFGADVLSEDALGKEIRIGGAYRTIELKLTDINDAEKQEVYNKVVARLSEIFGSGWAKTYSANLFEESETAGKVNLVLSLPEISAIETEQMVGENGLLNMLAVVSKYDYTVILGENAETIVFEVFAEESEFTTINNMIIMPTMVQKDGVPTASLSFVSDESEYISTEGKWVLKYSVIEKELFAQNFFKSGTNTMLISSAFNMATRLEYGVGAELVNKNGQGGVTYSIKGVIEEESNLMGAEMDSELITDSTLKEILDRMSAGSVYALRTDETAGLLSDVNGKLNPINAVYFRFADENDVEEGAGYINSALMSDMRTSLKYSFGDFMIISMSSVAEIVDTGMDILTILLTVIAGISVVVGGVGIMNIMIVVVSERTREIGIRKAIGARRSSILMQFLNEAVIITVCGGIVGLVLAQLAGLLIGHIMGIAMWIPLWVVGMSLGFCVVIGVIFGMYPAIKASKMHPIDALRHE